MGRISDMQLEDELFGVRVIQIGPLFGRVLNLLAGRLKKEIGLTQDMMELFITYEIPSGLFSYDGEILDSVVGTTVETSMVCYCAEATDGVEFFGSDMPGVSDRVEKRKFNSVRSSLDRRSSALLSGVTATTTTRSHCCVHRRSTTADSKIRTSCRNFISLR